LILALMWFFQVVLLEEFYLAGKQSEMRDDTELIVSLVTDLTKMPESALKQLCAEREIKLTVCNEVEFDGAPVSSTRIRECLKNGDIRTANKMLGRYFSYDFEVVHGDARGRILGSPTINQFFSENFTVAEYGVYASFTAINGKKYISVTNIGVRPTIKGGSEKRSETNIVGFEGDLYGKNIEVFLVEKLRGEMAFNSLEALSAQIAVDREKTREIMKKEFQNEF